MDRRPALAAALALASMLPPNAAFATESVPETNVVVSKSTFKGTWPLPFDRATLTCRPKGYANTIATPQGAFALNEAAQAQGLPALRALPLKGKAAPNRKADLDGFAGAMDALCSKRWSRP